MANVEAEFDFSRFIEAQEPVLSQVLQELRMGEKRSHWMWFIFPQLRGLGHSATAHYYAIASLAEASAYLRHKILGPRLVECTSLVNEINGRSVHQIFGTPDDLKFHSSMTLFCLADPAQPAFKIALGRYFGDEPDSRTVELCRSAR